MSSTVYKPMPRGPKDECPCCGKTPPCFTGFKALKEQECTLCKAKIPRGQTVVVNKDQKHEHCVQCLVQILGKEFGFKSGMPPT